MSQVVVYKGVMVEPQERSGKKIRIQTKNAGDAQRAGIPFKELDQGAAVFEAWVPEEELVAVDNEKG